MDLFSMDNTSIWRNNISSGSPRVCQSSLWYAFQAHLPEVETEEVRVALGYDVVEKDIRLEDEVSSLVRILVDLHQQSNEKLEVWKRKTAAVESGHDQDGWETHALERQVRELLKRLDKDGSEILRGASDKLGVYFDTEWRDAGDYKIQNIPTVSPIEHSSGVIATKNELSEGDKVHQQTGCHTNLESLLRSIGGKVDIFDIDRIVPTLRSAFKKEEARRYMEIDQLRCQIENESKRLATITMKVDSPSLEELKLVRSRLEEALRQKELLKQGSKKKELPVLMDSHSLLGKKIPKTNLGTLELPHHVPMKCKQRFKQDGFMAREHKNSTSVEQKAATMPTPKRGGKKMMRIQEMRRQSDLGEDLALDDLKHFTL